MLDPCTGIRVEAVEGDEPMGAIDRAWLAMDRPANPMIVSAIFEMDDVEDVSRLGRAIFEGLSQHDRFRQRIDDVRRPRAWTRVEALDPGYHVQLRRPRGVRALEDLKADISAEIGRALDPAFPLWRVFLFPTSARKVAVLFRAHHAMADGISLMRLLLRLMDAGARPDASATATRPAPDAGPLGAIIDRLSRLNRALIRAHRFEQALLDGSATNGASLKAALDAAASIGRTLAGHHDRPACLSGALEGHRRLDWSRPLPLAPLRERAHTLDLTLNDLFLAALAGALGHYLRSHGPTDESCEVRVSIPVNLRAVDDASLGNQFGLVLLDLPVGVEDAVSRRVIVGQRMRRLKRSLEAKAMLAALAALGHLPASAGKALVDRVASTSCAVVSNLPGPDHVLRFDSARLTRAMFLPPQTGHIGLGISILTYAGNVSLAVCSDTGVVAEPGQILRPFAKELKSLIGPQSSRAHAPALSKRGGRAARPIHAGGTA